ncbi:uncharacterized protein LOC100844639 [Brachypodium distachyon]|uniref:VQ domain-containing protein n=1 Tax=Brachypodium distachyon TaxID=15368 RepID=I1GPL9_BRADI|nr:uncharacterized protein LOC100844639 [Brachypodium distachyon]KQK13800.1 hypothetical protein BRADI_1g12580v3 [Brachypodium distachyon]|eukprot:XP_003561371.1 uncharacterized protein LOC100844639 [Brachypodium distachyon]
MEHGERRNGAHEAALRAVQRAPAKPWRGATGAGSLPPAPPKVYRVEPRGFRELVQRLTGSGTAPSMPAQQAMHVPPPAQGAAAAHGGRMEAAAAAPEQFDYNSWFYTPLLSPASMAMPPGTHGHHGALL